MFKEYEKRIAVGYFIYLVSMFLIIIRIANLMLDPELQSVANANSRRIVTVTTQRGTVFDSKMRPITNAEKKYITLITDIPTASVTLCDYFTSQEVKDILNSIRTNRIPIFTSYKNIVGNGVKSYEFSEHNEKTAKHLIGYTDQSGHGVSGLEATFDDMLYSGKNATISFSIDGLGNLMKGEEIIYEYDKDIEKSGIALTIDLEIQNICETAANELKCGAVVILEVETGEIKAAVSRPDFNIFNLADALDNPDSPLLNRSFQAYNVGSVFKPLVAAAAIEKGKSDTLGFCAGYSEIDGQRFRCHKTTGHGWLDMAGALKFSCNAYFYNLAIDVGCDKIYKMSEISGFNNAVSFGYGLGTVKAQIGDKSWLSKSQRALANLAIGQGQLMLSPIGILNLYAAIAGDGGYYTPSLIKGMVKNNTIVDETPKSEKINLMSKNTAKLLRGYLEGVLDENGTGAVAKPNTVSAAGKT
ncbi:MAG: hypothetical protein J6V50_00420, partial [Clostridia bacterium]|nr:hypothetical protein [Clostridia bacterium]